MIPAVPVVIRRANVADAAAIAAVRVDSWRTTYRGVIPRNYLDEMEVDESTALWTRVLSAGSNKACVFVAEINGEIVGFSAGQMLEEPKFGCNAELAAIYLRSNAQRQGVGRRLVSMVADAHQAHGATGLLVWVIAANKVARQFFEQLGAGLQIEQPFTWDELELTEVGYCWRDLEELQKACQ